MLIFVDDYVEGEDGVKVNRPHAMIIMEPFEYTLAEDSDPAWEYVHSRQGSFRRHTSYHPQSSAGWERIGSKGLPAVIYTVIYAWYGVSLWRLVDGTTALYCTSLDVNGHYQAVLIWPNMEGFDRGDMWTGD